MKTEELRIENFELKLRTGINEHSEMKYDDFMIIVIICIKINRIIIR